MRILVIDNHDSFVYNLVQYLQQLGAECEVRLGDQLTVAGALRLRPHGILISPGPGTPQRAGVSVEVVAALAGKVPILGVCLGHQAIAVAFGATVAQAPELRHGHTSTVTHAGAGVLAGLANPFTATRYHSLAVREPTLPPELEVTARTAAPPDALVTPDTAAPADALVTPDTAAAARIGSANGESPDRGGVVMAIRHRTLPVEGVQFHPESVLTEGGHLLLANWLGSCGFPAARQRAPALAAEVETRRRAAFTAA